MRLGDFLLRWTGRRRVYLRSTVSSGRMRIPRMSARRIHRLSDGRLLARCTCRRSARWSGAGKRIRRRRRIWLHCRSTCPTGGCPSGGWCRGAIVRYSGRSLLVGVCRKHARQHRAGSDKGDECGHRSEADPQAAVAFDTTSLSLRVLIFHCYSVSLPGAGYPLIPRRLQLWRLPRTCLPVLPSLKSRGAYCP
jgi:hypothetical protein